MSFLKNHLFLVYIIVFLAILLSANWNKPFIGHHDWNGAWYSNQARNYLRYGFFETKLGAVMNTDYTTKEDFNFFTHYPLLLPILIAASFKLFGIHEWSARLIPAVFTLGTIISIYLLTLKFFDKKITIAASLIAAVLPITIYFGKMPVQEVLVLPLVILSVYFYFNFFNKTTRANFIYLAISLLASHLTNWPGYYATPLFFAHYLIFSKAKNKLAIASIFPFFSVLMFGLHMLHLYLLTGNPLFGMIDVVLLRLNLKEKIIGYSTLNFLELQSRFLAIYFTRPVILFSIVTTIWMVIKIINKKITQEVQLFFILAIFGATHNLVFRNMAYIHDYMIIYLLPFLAISSAFGLFLILGRLKLAKRSLVLSLIVLGFAGLVLLERSKFVKTLLTSEGFYEGYQLGNAISRETSSQDKVLIISPEFKNHFEVFTAYYSDRNIEYEIPQEQEDLSYYKLIIAIPSRDTPLNLINKLESRFQTVYFKDYLIFDTTKPTYGQTDFGNHSAI